MNTRNLLAVVAIFSFGFAIGCDVPELEGIDAPSAMPAPRASAEITEGEAEKKKEGWEQTELVDMEPAVTSTPREVTANDPTKGKRSRQAGGYLGAVGHTRFYAEHKMIFINVDKAMQLYWAPEGKYPATHEEFMEKVIKFNQIQLPELDEGVEYIYDPEDHKLKIHRPGAPPSDESQDDAQEESQDTVETDPQDEEEK